MLEIFNSFAPWFSAFGTLSAVIVSLYIALSNRKISIAISSEVFNFNNGNESLIIRVTNTGFRTVVINNQASICFQVGGLNKKKNIGIGANYIDQQRSSTFPCRLTEGETLDLVVNLKNSDGNWLHNFKKKFLTESSTSTLRVIVYPNVGKPIKERVGSSLVKELKQS